MYYILMQQDVDSICAWVDQNLLLLNTLNVVIYCSQENLLQPSILHHCLSMTPPCTWLNNLNTLRSPLMQLGLHTSTLFA